VKTYKSKLYHIYDHVRDDLSRNAQEHEPLPDLVMNAYLLLGKDWLITRQAWDTLRYPTPPVMITVANRTETAARVKYAFDKRKVLVDELCEPDQTLHIDSKVLEMAEAREEELDAGQADDLNGAEGEEGEAPKKKLRSPKKIKFSRKKMLDKRGSVAQ
jgi:type III restriction enzyme